MECCSLLTKPRFRCDVFVDFLRDLPSRLLGFGPKSIHRLFPGNPAATPRQPGGILAAAAGKDILGPVEDLLNKNPSQSLSGKNEILKNDPKVTPK